MRLLTTNTSVSLLPRALRSVQGAVATWSVISIRQAQSNKTAINHESLMDMRFYENDGGFLVEMLHFNFWLSTRELPAGMRRPKITLHLVLNGKEVAVSRSPSWLILWTGISTSGKS